MNTLTDADAKTDDQDSRSVPKTEFRDILRPRLKSRELQPCNDGKSLVFSVFYPPPDS